MVPEVNPYLALRIDVETAAGLALGLPPLLATLESCGVSATVMVPTGPDRSGLALARILRSPGRIRQILRLRPGGRRALFSFLAGIAVPIRSMEPCLRASCRLLLRHEVGLHGHDHWGWIHRGWSWPAPRVRLELRRGAASFARALASRAQAFAAPGWVATDASLEAIDEGGFRYASDCRGTSPFVPEGRRTPQLPTTLPTLEEIIRGGRTLRDLWAHLDRVGERPYSCYCAHAEVEGMRAPEFLPRLLERVARTALVGPLGATPALANPLPCGRIAPGRGASRFDPVACQVAPCESC